MGGRSLLTGAEGYGGFAACGAALVSLVLYLIFKNSVTVLARLGKIGTLVMIRMMAFILLCIGIQIMWTGWAELNEGAGVTVSETQFRPTPDSPPSR